MFIYVYVYWCKNSCKNSYSNSNGFEVNVGMHQGSALSPLLSMIVTEALSREFRVALPWELLYADDLVVIAETEDDLINWLSEWKDSMENIVWVAMYSRRTFVLKLIFLQFLL